MGDRTTVEFYVRSTKIPKEFMDDTDECNIEGNITYLSQDEANYGSWEELEEYLKDNEIEFDKYWGAGSEYSAGKGYARKTPKGFKYFEIYETEKDSLNSLITLSKIKDPKKLMATIKKRIKELQPFIPRNINTPNSLDFITKK